MKAMTDGAILARLCGNVTAGRFDWRKYCVLRRPISVVKFASRRCSVPTDR